MGYTPKELDDPLLLYSIRMRQLRVRIQHLQNDLVIAQHPFSKAVIKQEISNTVDEYVTRRLQEGNRKTN